jgi:WD40 repeat protein
MSVLRHELLESISLNLSSLHNPSRSRIRYSCLDASENFLVLGANTGSLYFYERDTLAFLQLLTLIQEPIVQVKFSPNERFVAIATSKNYNIVVIEPNLRSKKDKERIVMTVTEHKSEITCLSWAGSGPQLRLFSGDESGAVYVTSVGARLKTFFTSTSDSEYLYKCDTRVVQLHYDDDLNQLLVSNLTNSLIINFAKNAVVPVGKNRVKGLMVEFIFQCVNTQMQQRTPLASTTRLLATKKIPKMAAIATIHHSISFKSTLTITTIRVIRKATTTRWI